MMPSRRIRRLAPLGLFLPLTLAVHSVRLAAQQVSRPLSLDQTVTLVQGGLTDRRVIDIVEERGVDYPLNASARTRLDAAGADAAVETAIDRCYRPPSAPILRSDPSTPTPSLADTLHLLQQQLSQQGVTAYTAFYHDTSGQSPDWTNRYVSTASNVLADPATCHIGYHWRATRDDAVLQDQQSGFLLKNVLSVSLLTRGQELKAFDASLDKPSLYARIEPAIYAVQVRRPNNVINSFYFYDETLASRVANELSLAVQLCGGGEHGAF